MEGNEEADRSAEPFSRGTFLPPEEPPPELPPEEEQAEESSSSIQAAASACETVPERSLSMRRICADVSAAIPIALSDARASGLKRTEETESAFPSGVAASSGVP